MSLSWRPSSVRLSVCSLVRLSVCPFVRSSVSRVFVVCPSLSVLSVASSLVVVRTERGRAFLRSAIDAGAVELERVPDRLLVESQPNLLKTRGAVWGRIMASRLLLLPAPRYERMPTFRHWWGELTVIERIRSFTGTVKRIVTRRLHRRRPVEPLDPSTLPYQ